MKNVEILRVEENNYELRIGNDVEIIELEKNEHGGLIHELGELRGKIKVIGGENLKSTEFMFYECEFDEVDLSEFKSSNVEKMEGMFIGSKIGKVIMPKNGLGSNKLITTQHMFCKSNIREIDLSKMNMDEVENVSCMFVKFRTGTLDLRSWNLGKVKNHFWFLKDCVVDNKLLSDSVKSLC